MKLSETTQNLIKNFSTINKSLLVREGTTLTTISPSKSIYARAKVSEDFPKRCAIYELNRFLGAYSLFEDPNIEFQDNQLAITDGKHTVQYTYASENAIVAPPEKDIKIPSEDITFKLPAAEFSGLIRAANVLSLKNVVVTNEDGEFKVSARDHKNPNSDEYSANVTEYTSDSSSFSIIFSVENLMKLLVKDYTVTIASAGISRFESPEVTYFVALENDSEFQ